MSKTTDDYANKNQELEPGPKHEKEKNHTRVVSLPLWDLRGKPIERNWRLRVRPRHSAAHLIGCLLREYCTYTRIVDACELQRKDLYRTHESCMMMVMMMMSMMALVPLWARPRRLMFYACTSFRSFQVLTPGSPKSQPFYTLFIDSALYTKQKHKYCSNSTSVVPISGNSSGVLKGLRAKWGQIWLGTSECKSSKWAIITYHYLPIGTITALLWFAFVVCTATRSDGR